MIVCEASPSSRRGFVVTLGAVPGGRRQFREIDVIEGEILYQHRILYALQENLVPLLFELMNIAGGSRLRSGNEQLLDNAFVAVLCRQKTRLRADLYGYQGLNPAW